MQVKRETWGKTSKGESAALFRLDDGRGMELVLGEYGAAMVSLSVPGQNGESEEVLLGYDDVEEYEADDAYFGVLVGPTANRVRNARFFMDDVEYELDANHGEHHLHGGEHGFSDAVWRGEPAVIADMPGVVFELKRKHMQDGYPGNRTFHAAYSLPGPGRIRLEIAASTDKPSPVDVAGHAYFNLAGEGDILDHILTIHASSFLEIDEDLLPTGRLLPVHNTPMDFTGPNRIGTRINSAYPPLEKAGGYDHYYVLDKLGAELRPAAEVLHPGSGRIMQVLTTCPGLQFYSGNAIASGVRGRDGAVYDSRSGLCLEAQGYPDAINHPEFPSAFLHPGMEYRQVVEYRFSVQEPEKY